MPKRLLKRLEDHIRRTGRYEPLVVRPHPSRQGGYQVINGHHRLAVLRRLGHRQAACVVWDVDDDETLVLLATLNRLSGRDELVRKADLVAELARRFDMGDLAAMLPDSRPALERLRHMAVPGRVADGPNLPGGGVGQRGHDSNWRGGDPLQQGGDPAREGDDPLRQGGDPARRGGGLSRHGGAPSRQGDDSLRWGGDSSRNGGDVAVCGSACGSGAAGGSGAGSLAEPFLHAVVFFLTDEEKRIVDRAVVEAGRTIHDTPGRRRARVLVDWARRYIATGDAADLTDTTGAD